MRISPIPDVCNSLNSSFSKFLPHLKHQVQRLHWNVSKADLEIYMAYTQVLSCHRRNSSGIQNSVHVCGTFKRPFALIWGKHVKLCLLALIDRCHIYEHIIMQLKWPSSHRTTDIYSPLAVRSLLNSYELHPYLWN